MKKEIQNKKSYNLQCASKRSRGITLIALVVTIIILLILAAISITAVFGENGLITRADKAKTKTEKGIADDAQGMKDLNSQINAIVNGTTGGGSEEKTPTSTIEALMEDASDKNELILDKYKNKIVVPAGFKIVPHGTKENDNNMVEYTYDKQDGTSTNIPVVQDGIVIKDASETDGNEFVWVPVGEIKNDAEPNTTNTTTITLGRYSDYTVAEDGTLPTPVQVASKTDYDTPINIKNSFQSRDNHFEISSNFAGGTFNGTTYKAASNYGNTKAFDLQEWISKTIDNGGYYIARYEASKNGEKAASKVSTGTPRTSSTTLSDGMLWNYINQPNAAIAAKAMYPYSEGAKYYSDLINSYAWDTAIIFIEAYEDSTYASKRGVDINNKLTNTGVNADKRCNIHDMAGNTMEWATETSTNLSYPCTCKGGQYGTRGDCTSYRNGSNTSYNNDNISFRTSLCVK